MDSRTGLPPCPRLVEPPPYLEYSQGVAGTRHVGWSATRSVDVAGVRSRREGRNRLPRAQRPSLVRLLFREATHFFALMLGGDAVGGVPVPAPLSGVLGGAWPGPWGWLIAASAIPVVLLVDARQQGTSPILTDRVSRRSGKAASSRCPRVPRCGSARRTGVADQSAPSPG